MYENNIKTTVFGNYYTAIFFGTKSFLLNNLLKVYFFTTGQITSLNICFYWKAQKEYLRSIIRFCTVSFGL
jgi:hypothetical protein